MKAILLAAGKGTRISRMIEAVPKSVLPINGEPLIRHTVKILQEMKIETIVCVGYQADKVKEALSGLSVKYYYNPFYNITNSIASLWFAMEELENDVLIFNADVFFSTEILGLVLKDTHNNVMAIDKTRTSVGDYFFTTTDNGYITKYGKDLPLTERSCEYVGIAKITSDFIGHFKERLKALMMQERYDYWWENVLYSFADSEEYHINTVDVEGLFWSEIDFFDDYERILNHLDKERET